MDHHNEAFVGIDVAEPRNAIALADGERGGEVRFFGEVDAAEDSMRRVVMRLFTDASKGLCAPGTRLKKILCAEALLGDYAHRRWYLTVPFH